MTSSPCPCALCKRSTKRRLPNTTTTSKSQRGFTVIVSSAHCRASRYQAAEAAMKPLLAQFGFEAAALTAEQVADLQTVLELHAGNRRASGSAASAAGSV